MRKKLKAVRDDTEEVIEGIIHLPEDCKQGDLVEFKYVNGEFMSRIIGTTQRRYHNEQMGKKASTG